MRREFNRRCREIMENFLEWAGRWIAGRSMAVFAMTKPVYSRKVSSWSFVILSSLIDFLDVMGLFPRLMVVGPE